MVRVPNFDADNHKSTPRDVLPEGTYRMVMGGSKLRPTRGGDTQLVIKWCVTEGEHKGAVFYQSLWAAHKNPKAVNVGNFKLAEIARACGKKRFSDTDELLGIPVTARVMVRPSQGGYPPDNDIEGFEKVDEVKPAQAQRERDAAALSPDDIPF